MGRLSVCQQAGGALSTLSLGTSEKATFLLLVPCHRPLDYLGGSPLSVCHPRSRVTSPRVQLVQAVPKPPQLSCLHTAPPRSCRQVGTLIRLFAAPDVLPAARQMAPPLWQAACIGRLAWNAAALRLPLLGAAVSAKARTMMPPCTADDTATTAELGPAAICALLPRSSHLHTSGKSTWTHW